MSSPEKFWHDYILTLDNISIPKKGFTSWYFGDNEHLANELLGFVRKETSNCECLVGS